MFRESKSGIQSVFSFTSAEALLHAALILLLLAVTFMWLWKRRSRSRLPPGPTGLPLVGYLPFVGSEPHKTFLELGKKYNSSIVGMNLGHKYTVILNEYEVMKEVLSHPAVLDRPPDMFDLIEGVGFGTQNGEAWTVQRRFFMHIARDLGLGRGIGEELMQDEVKSFVEELASFKGIPVDVSSDLMRSISNSMFSLLVSRRFEKGKEDDKLQLLEEFSDVSLSYIAPTFLTTIIPKARKIFEYLKIAGYDRASKIVRRFTDLVREEIARHNTSDHFGENDFINMYESRLKESIKKENNRYFSDKDLQENIKLIFLAASDTTTTSVMWLIYFMSRYPEVQKKVQEELNTALGEDGVVSYYERHKIPYTFATLMESQRFSTIVRLSTTRRVNADFEIYGYRIPKGSHIMGNVWALHNDPKYWPEPEKFRPERFLDSGGQLIKNPQSYAVFSFGRRNCPGETIAWMRILSYITSILRRFDIRPPPGASGEWDITPGLVLHLKTQPLCFVERKR